MTPNWKKANEARWPAMSSSDYLAKLKSRSIVTESGCWEMQSFRRQPRGMAHRGPQYGYGMMSYRGKNTTAHRIAWICTHGEIPKGMVVMHICDNPPCCNPDHLKLGTPQENSRDMSAKKRAAGQWKTHCKRGHPLSGANLVMVLHSNGNYMRRCKACGAVRQRLKAGWPEDLAMKLPTRRGQRPVNASWSRRTG